ncbi:MAG TPA: tetratricopeptide repeat protein, partial [Terriglobales bacterium]
EGTTLRQKIGAPLPVAEFLEIATQCAEALVAAHQKGVVHCDIKPENVMITPAGQVKILDFGIAKRLPFYDTEDTTRSVELQGLVGTPAYMAPEVLAGKAPDARSDIYSLGVTLYEALTGRRPTQPGVPVAADAGAPAAVHPAIPEAIELGVKKMLQPDPVQRYQDAVHLLRDLRSLHQPGPQPEPIPARLAGRRGAIVTGCTLLLALLAWVAVEVVWPRLYRAAYPVPEEKQVAVLPFTVAGADAGTTAFANGISEVLSAKLTQLTERPQFQVVPVSEVRARQVATAADARKEFGVNLVIEGTWQQAGGTVHVMSVLIDATSNRQLRADEFVASSSDPLGLEAQVASGVLQMLEIELQPSEQQPFKGHGRAESGAYAYYLRGSGYLDEFARPENIDNAISEFNGALQLDPYYARALAGLGEAYWKKYEATNDPQWTRPAKTNCERAVSLAESESSGHACLGQVLLGTGEYKQAVVQYQRALELEPTSDEAVAGLASAYSDLGETQEAEATFRRAIALRPNYWMAYNALGRFYYEHGRYDEAADMFNKVVSIAPDSFRGWSNLGGAEVQAGRFEKGIQLLQHSMSIRPTYMALSNMAVAFFKLRRFDEAAASFNDALRYNDRDYVVWGNLGLAYQYAGDHARAAVAFQQAVSRAKERLQVNSQDPLVLADLATYYSALGQQALAFDSIRHALRLAPSNPELLLDEAMMYNDSGDTERAVRAVRNALLAGYTLDSLRDAPAFDNLRGDARFKSLLEEFGSRRGHDAPKTP